MKDWLIIYPTRIYVNKIKNRIKSKIHVQRFLPTLCYLQFIYCFISYIVNTRKLTEYRYVSEQKYVGVETKGIVLVALSEGIIKGFWCKGICDYHSV